MAAFSILTGYYSINVFKQFGQTIETLSNDEFLTWVGSVAALFNTARFVWSGFLDHYSYKKVYGLLLLLQIFLGSTMSFAIQSKGFYMTWISLALFCEGAHFTLVPNILKKIFGRQATSLYGIAFSYTGLASVLILVLLEIYPTDYLMFFALSAILSLLALLVLLIRFDEEPWYPDRKELVFELKKKLD